MVIWLGSRPDDHLQPHLKNNIAAGLRRFPAGYVYHFGRRIDPVDLPGRPDLGFSPQRQGARAATDIQDSFRGLKIRQAQRRLPQPRFLSQRQ